MTVTRYSASPSNYAAITDKLTLYAHALDKKDFELFWKVFHPYAKADYPFNHDLTPLQDIEYSIRDRLGPIKTHHSLSVPLITFPTQEYRNNMAPEEDWDARSETHFTATHFGQGPHEGKILQAWGKYIDEWVCLTPEQAQMLEWERTDPAEGDPVPDWRAGVVGVGGVWFIQKRSVEMVKRIGDEKIMTEF